jgi:hypothetical protein
LRCRRRARSGRAGWRRHHADDPARAAVTWTRRADGRHLRRIGAGSW